MYSWIWRKLPGTFVQKTLLAALLGAVALVAMYFFVFPWLDTVIFPESETEIQQVFNSQQVCLKWMHD